MDDAAFTEFAHGVAPMLQRTAWLLTGNAHDTDDLVQDTLATMYKAMQRRRGIDNPAGYARRVLTRKFLDTRRLKRSTEVVTDRVPETTSTEDPDTALTVRAALARLAPADRAVLVLRHFYDLPVPEVAAELGIGEGAARTRASRAAARLRELLSDPARSPE